uniref:Uncharacterized protein n=1 Tax=Mycena chlorophos TaxID=658473 RepID=A0ABQ0LPA6_MYCCL|nr:predicted protein [Mycena chlorophos]
MRVWLGSTSPYAPLVICLHQHSIAVRDDGSTDHTPPHYPTTTSLPSQHGEPLPSRAVRRIPAPPQRTSVAAKPVSEANRSVDLPRTNTPEHHGHVHPRIQHLRPRTTGAVRSPFYRRRPPSAPASGIPISKPAVRDPATCSIAAHKPGPPSLRRPCAREHLRPRSGRPLPFSAPLRVNGFVLLCRALAVPRLHHVIQAATFLRVCVFVDQTWCNVPLDTIGHHLRLVIGGLQGRALEK